MRRILILLGWLIFPGTLLAQEQRPLCPDRPGLGTPACTTAPGAIMLEIGLADWSRNQDIATRSDTLVAGDALLRVGLTPSLEAQIGWTAFGYAHEEDRLTGRTTDRSGTGDVMIALRQNMKNPDGSGFAVAAMPYVTLPIGHSAIGAGDWSLGFQLPLSLEAGPISLGLTPHIDGTVDSDGKGRHLAYGTVAGVGFALSDAVAMTVEMSATRDRDPGGHITELLGGVSAGWQPDANRQWDIGVNVGLNRNSPDVQLYVGITQRF